jgi:hypothetical protein
MIPTDACIRFRPGDIAQVDAALRLTCNSFIQCCTYPDRPAIVSIRDEHVAVSIGTPSSAAVSLDDLEAATRLAEALVDYIGDLRSRLATQKQAPDAAA